MLIKIENGKIVGEVGHDLLGYLEEQERGSAWRKEAFRSCNSEKLYEIIRGFSIIQ